MGISVEDFVAGVLPVYDPDSDSAFTVNATRVLDQLFIDNAGQCVQPGVVVFVARSRHSAKQPDEMFDNDDDLYDIQYSILTAVEKGSGVGADQQLNVNKWSDPPNYTVEV